MRLALDYFSLVRHCPRCRSIFDGLYKKLFKLYLNYHMLTRAKRVQLPVNGFPGAYRWIQLYAPLSRSRLPCANGVISRSLPPAQNKAFSSTHSGIHTWAQDEAIVRVKYKMFIQLAVVTPNSSSRKHIQALNLLQRSLLAKVSLWCLVQAKNDATKVKRPRRTHGAFGSDVLK